MPLEIDINKDQQFLLWRRHLLTEVMETGELTDLALEPVLDPPEAEEARVKIENTNAALKWDWANWMRVDISANHLDELAVVRSYVPVQTPEAKWRDLPILNEVEVRFEDENGTVACAKLQVPELTNFGRDVEFGRWIRGSVQVRLTKPAKVARVEVELLRPGQSGTFKRKGKPFEFRVGEKQMDLPVPDDFFGIIAVIAKQPKSERLIAAADFNDQFDVIPQTVVNDRLQQVIESRYGEAPKPKLQTIEEWLRSWPSYSQQRLVKLYDLAQQYFSEHQLICKDEYVREYPTGLLRYLTLVQCGFESSEPGRLIRRLNNNSFQKALNVVLPTLGAVLAVLTTSDEKVWAIENARNPHLQAAVSDAQNEGVAALARALHLAEKRAEAIAAWEARQVAASISKDSTKNKR